ncbi:MAG: YqgE/AlgH family protein [Actinomycetota bacterium]
MSLAGRLLVATPLITDPNFIHTVVYIYAHDSDDGAAGVVLNRPTDEPTLSHLPGWRSVLAPPPNVFWGGPVAPDSGLVLMLRDGVVQLAEELEPPDPPARARLFVGQAGWGPGQLEGELTEEAWLVAEPQAEEVLAPFPDDLWGRMVRRQGGRAALWSTHPLDPRMN